jgi:sugar porter (SP) family MFS transporter
VQVPIYIAEISPPAIRGRLVGTYELGWQIGGMVGFWINYGMIKTLPSGREQWLTPFAIQLVPAGVLLIGSLFLKETPRWLFTKGRVDEAISNLCWIRNLNVDDTYIVEEIAMMDEQISDLPRGFFQPIKEAFQDPKTRWRLFLGHSLFILQNFAGINAINYYSPNVFRSVGIQSQDTIYLTTGIFGVVKTVITILWLTVLIDKWGRRHYGAIGGSATMFIIGALITARVQSDTPVSSTLSSSGIATVFMVYLWTAIYVNSWNGTPWVINAEMFSQRTRSIGQLFASMANWLWTFIIARVTPNMIDGMGESGYGSAIG